MRGMVDIGSFLAATLLTVACGKQATSGAAVPQTSLPAAEEPAAREERRPLVVFLGDSLTAAYGLPEDQGFPARVAALLEAEGHPIRIVNAGVSGDTTAGGLRRLDWLLAQKPEVLVVGLGANDGLQGLPPEESARNLREILQSARDAGARVLLLGMRLPPNYGRDYVGKFEAIYPTLAKERKVPLVPFLLEGVGGDPDLNLPDGIHPNAAGHERLAQNVLPRMRELLAP